MKSSKFLRGTIGAILAVALILALLNAFIDPYMHFHKPIDFISYRLNDERYMNDGIARQYDYDAVIVGSSMTQNFKTSEWESLTGEAAVKLSLSGGSFIEIRNQLERVLKYNPDVKSIIWGVDYDFLIRAYDYDGYGAYPDYLYDNNPINDVEYLLNKDVLCQSLVDIKMTLSGQPDMPMDEYQKWVIGRGYESVMLHYDRPEDNSAIQQSLSDEEQEMVRQNVVKNLTEIADEYPEVTFYMFYTPYSIVSWDKCHREGSVLRHIDAEEIATEELLKHSNIKLYSFFDDRDLICNLDNYKDPQHYVEDINSLILVRLLGEEYLVTKDNYLSRISANRDYFLNYDYDSIFE